MFSKVSRPSGQIDTGLGQKSPRNGCSWVHRWVQTLAADLQYALWPKNTFLWLPQFKHHPLTAEPENKPPEPSPADGWAIGFTKAGRRREGEPLIATLHFCSPPKFSGRVQEFSCPSSLGMVPTWSAPTKYMSRCVPITRTRRSLVGDTGYHKTVVSQWPFCWVIAACKCPACRDILSAPDLNGKSTQGSATFALALFLHEFSEFFISFNLIGDWKQ